jgi:hypothetical protein
VGFQEVQTRTGGACGTLGVFGLIFGTIGLLVDRCKACGLPDDSLPDPETELPGTKKQFRGPEHATLNDLAETERPDC